MANAHRTATIGYLVLVLLLAGASAAGDGANLLLQLIGAALVAWSLQLRPAPIGVVAVAIGLLAIVQFVPLPPELWSRLPGREGIAHGFAMLGSGLPWLTVSLAPWHSLASLAWWIPALALFLAVRAHGTSLARPAARAIVGVAALSMIVGLAQWLRGLGYVYAVTNYGRAPGFFANSNHQSLFLLVAAILCIEDAFHPRLRLTAWRSRRTAIAQLLLVPLFLFGIAINGSLAVAVLIIPVAGALVAVIGYGERRRFAGIALAVALILAGGALGAVALDIFPNDLFGQAAVPGIGRRAFWSTTLAMIANAAPVGSGLGTFQQLYHWYEDPATVSSIYVNHAHNDLLELLAETGIFGAMAVAAFLAWFVPNVLRLWRAPDSPTPALAATIVIAAALLHSLVDYPLRTAALSGIVAVACALVAAAARREPHDPFRTAAESPLPE